MKSKNALLLISLLFIFDRFCLHITGFDEYEPDSTHHRTRRSVYALADIPQPSAEYPIVVFSELNYNNASAGSRYTRLKEDEFHVWGKTITDQKREFVYKSLIVMPGRTLTFKGCCPSGNIFHSSINNITNISDIHLWMFDNQDVGGSSGIWYTEWTHWLMDFSVKVEPCPHCASPNCSGKTCYFGTCGIDGDCQCIRGYSGNDCSTRPSDSANYPSIQYPLILFPDTFFKGTPIKQVAADTFEVFAKTSQNELVYTYKSMRTLCRRKVTFSRVDHNVQFELPIGRDIEDISSYMTVNDKEGNDLWINYSNAISLSFAVKVADNPTCTNCSDIGGSCCTGSCVCLPGHSGDNCEI